MTKKIIITLVLCFSLIGASIQSKAVAPLLVALGFMDGAGAFTSSGLALLTTGAMLTPAALQPLIGQRMGMVEFGRDNDGNGTIDQSYRIPLTNATRDRPQANPQLPQIKPLDNPPTTSTTSTCPPDTVTTAQSYTCVYTVTHSYSLKNNSTCNVTVSTAGISGCEDYLFVLTPAFTVEESAIQGCPSGYIRQGSGCASNGTTPQCSTGYVSQNGQCVLTEPEKISDGKCDIESFSPSPGLAMYREIPSDPDCNGSGLSISQAAAIFKMTHPETGQVVNYSVTQASDSCPYGLCPSSPLPDGHTRITATTNTASGGQSVNVDVNNQTGTITQVGSVPLNGQLIREGQTYVNAAGQTVTVQAGQLVLVNASGGTYVQAPTNTVAPSSINISIPTDYARSGEAETSADKIIEKLDETQESADLLAPELVNPLDSYFNPLRAWSVPIRAGQCPTGSFNWNNNDYNFNVMCQLFNENLTLIQGAMSVFYTILALMIVLGA